MLPGQVYAVSAPCMHVPACAAHTKGKPVNSNIPTCRFTVAPKTDFSVTGHTRHSLSVRSATHSLLRMPLLLRVSARTTSGNVAYIPTSARLHGTETGQYTNI